MRRSPRRRTSCASRSGSSRSTTSSPTSRPRWPARPQRPSPSKARSGENHGVAVPDLIDLHHQDERIVACYLLETDDGLALHDCGPTTCVPTLKAALVDRGLALT